MCATKTQNTSYRMLTGGVFLAFVLGLFCSPLQAREITDKSITLAVERELVNDEGVPAHLVDVDTEEGIVTLSGAVYNILAKERAAEVVKTVKGVRSVVNRIKVRPVERTDGEIRENIEQALADDPGTDRYEITVDVEDGVATVDGTVDSWAEKQLCARVAKGVKGIRDLKNEISLKAREKRADSEIEAEIKRRLEWDALVDDALIHVKVAGGKVTLSGTVGSAFEKSRAYEDAWISGVTSVSHDNLEINWLLRDQMRRGPKYTSKADSEIEKAVTDAFRYDPRVSGSDVDVMVDYGVAILRGAVENLKARKAAGEDARNTAGVWRVKNRIRVRPSLGPSAGIGGPGFDSEIADKARLAFLRDPYMDQHEISVSVSNRLVRLSGRVDSEFERTRAEDIASGIRGVVTVGNTLKVNRPSWTEKDDWVIKDDIEGELWWSPFLDSDEISVSVKDGVAALVGVVDTLRERSIATENAYEGGAREVQNYLKVRQGPAYYQ